MSMHLSDNPGPEFLEKFIQIANSKPHPTGRSRDSGFSNSHDEHSELSALLVAASVSADVAIR